MYAVSATVQFIMRVWIDQDLCTGDGICVDHCPDVFVQLEDGIAYVAESGAPLNDPGGSGSLAWVTSRDIADVVHAAEACPGECIFIEVDLPVAELARDDAGDIAAA
jgi:ferredoxin